MPAFPAHSEPVELSPRDLYRFRRASLHAQRAALKAQSAQQALGELALELERRYNLLGQDARIDMHTGEIHSEASMRKVQET